MGRKICLFLYGESNFAHFCIGVHDFEHLNMRGGGQNFGHVLYRGRGCQIWAIFV